MNINQAAVLAIIIIVILFLSMRNNKLTPNIVDITPPGVLPVDPETGEPAKKTDLVDTINN